MAEKAEKLEGIIFFGEVDRNKHGRIASEYPSWYFENLVEKMEEEVDEKKRRLASGFLSDDNKMKLAKQIKDQEDRLEKINEAKVNLRGKHQDDVNKLRKELGEIISDSMYRQTDIDKRRADPHEEARRNMNPCIAVRGKLYDVAVANGFKVSKDGKMSRNEASRFWKIMNKALGEISNTSILRKR